MTVNNGGCGEEMNRGQEPKAGTELLSRVVPSQPSFRDENTQLAMSMWTARLCSLAMTFLSNLAIKHPLLLGSKQVLRGSK